MEDPTLELVGYQVHFEVQMLGFFLFTHTRCGTTLNLTVESLRDLYKGPVLTGRKVPSEAARHYCLHLSSPESCPPRCECTAIRELSRIIRQWKGSRAQDTHFEASP